MQKVSENKVSKYAGTVIEKVENGITSFYISNEKGEVVISKIQTKYLFM